MKQKNKNRLYELEKPIKAKEEEAAIYIYKLGDKLPELESGEKVKFYLPDNGRE